MNPSPFYSVSKMTKFAIEKYVSEHHARELECVFLKRLSHNTHNPPKMHLSTLDSLFKRRDRSLYPAGASSFTQYFETRPKYWSIWKIEQVRTRLVCRWYVKKFDQSKCPECCVQVWTCTGGSSKADLLQAFRVYITRYTKRNLSSWAEIIPPLSRMAKRTCSNLQGTAPFLRVLIRINLVSYLSKLHHSFAIPKRLFSDVLFAWLSSKCELYIQ